MMCSEISEASEIDSWEPCPSRVREKGRTPLLDVNRIISASLDV
jgi:hypothetical protein